MPNPNALFQRVPEAAAGRIVDSSKSTSPNSPNPAVIQNRKMKDWRSMDLCSDLVLRMMGLRRVEYRKDPLTILKQALL